MPNLDELTADRPLLAGYPWPERWLRWFVWMQLGGGLYGGPTRARRMLAAPLGYTEAMSVAGFEIGVAVLAVLFGSFAPGAWKALPYVVAVLLVARGTVLIRRGNAIRRAYVPPAATPPPPPTADDYQEGPAWEARADEVRRREDGGQ